MKRTLLLATSLLLLTITGLFAQKMTKAERQAHHAQKQAQYTASLKEALVEQHFHFVAQQVQSDYGIPAPILGTDNYINVYPDALDVRLPFSTNNFNRIGNQQIYFTTGSYGYSAKMDPDGKMVTVVITAQNVTDELSSQNEELIAAEGNFDYTIHMQISLANGHSTVTIIPTFGNRMTHLQGITPYRIITHPPAKTKQQLKHLSCSFGVNILPLLANIT